jgi:hypothetical protein
MWKMLLFELEIRVYFSTPVYRFLQEWMTGSPPPPVGMLQLKNHTKNYDKIQYCAAHA